MPSQYLLLRTHSNNVLIGLGHLLQFTLKVLNVINMVGSLMHAGVFHSIGDLNIHIDVKSCARIAAVKLAA